MTKKLNQVLIAVIVILIMYLYIHQNKTPHQISWPIETTGEVASWQVLTWATTGTLMTGQISSWAISDAWTLASGESLDHNVTGSIALIQWFYHAMQNHDFDHASALQASGESTPESLLLKYGNVMTLQPFRIQLVGENTYQFYVVYQETGSGQLSVFVVKKLVVGNVLQSINGKKIAPNAENEYFRFYQDNNIQVNQNAFKVLDAFTPEYFMGSSCTRSTSKDLAYFQKLLANFTKKDEGQKFTFVFKDLHAPVGKDKVIPTIGSGAHVYVIPNKMNYPDKKLFMDDFAMCSSTAKFVPLFINSNYLILTDSCGTSPTEDCNILHEIIQYAVKIK